jgi:hypothetical protein
MSRQIESTKGQDQERLRLKLVEAEHQQRIESTRIEQDRRMELIEAEAALQEARCRRVAEEITPNNTRLDAMAGTFTAPPGSFDDED